MFFIFSILPFLVTQQIYKFTQFSRSVPGPFCVMYCHFLFWWRGKLSDISLQNIGVDRRPPGLQNPVRTWQLREFNKKFQTLGVTGENTRSTLWDSMKSPCRVSWSGFSWDESFIFLYTHRESRCQWDLHWRTRPVCLRVAGQVQV